MAKPYTYRDFETGKQTFTKGRFDHWERGGPLDAWYAVFENKRSHIYVPHYCLTPETRLRLSQFTPKPTADTLVIEFYQDERGHWRVKHSMPEVIDRYFPRWEPPSVSGSYSFAFVVAQQLASMVNNSWWWIDVVIMALPPEDIGPKE